MIAATNILSERLFNNAPSFHSVVDFNPTRDKLLRMDFTEQNNELATTDFNDILSFSTYIENKLHKAKAKFGIGGYNELRSLYSRSKVFDAVQQNHEARRLHLGIDIWGEEGTKIYAPLGGMVHSYAFNKQFGDYGATLVLLHQLDTITFYTLYGHLSLADISRVSEFQYIVRGHVIGHFGSPVENGAWPPHLHFQVIRDMRMYKGDYPGVCSLSESENFLANCPDPDLILQMMKYAC